MKNSITLQLDIEDKKAIRKMIGVLNVLIGETELFSEPIYGTVETATVMEAAESIIPEKKAEVPAVPPKPAPISTDVELDSRGMPWDERIHSRTKSRLADGTWKFKRGVPENVRKSVEAEIGQVQMDVSQSAPQAPKPTEIKTEAPKAPAPVAPQAPQAPQAAPQAPTPEVNGAVTYEHVQAKVTAGVQAGKIGPDNLIPVLNQHGLNAIRDLQKFPELIPTINSDLDALIGAVH